MSDYFNEWKSDKEWSGKEDLLDVLLIDLNILLSQLCDKELKIPILEIEEFQSKLELLLKQGLFWLEQKNAERFLYDLEEFNMSLDAFLKEKKSK